MEEMCVYIANLGKYNEGEAVGEWFSLPINHEEMAERIGLNGRYEEYAIHDAQVPFEINEYMSIDELNTIYERLEELANTPIMAELKAIQDCWFSSVEDVADHKDDIYYHDCSDFTELAELFVELGYLGEIPDRLIIYIDYEAFGRDLSIEGNFLETSHGIFEYVG
jgi:Antirestriction protein